MKLVPVILVLSATAGISAVPDETLVDDGLTAGSSSSRQRSRGDSAQELHYLLFPNRTKSGDFDKNGRALSFANTPYTNKVRCQTCDNLKTCQILNTLLIQEVYYPSMYFPSTGAGSVAQAGTCEIIEQRGIRMSQQIFGPDKTFRDTPLCQGPLL